MATFEKTVQPQKGVYGWYAERSGVAVTVYIGKAGGGGTLCRGVSELLRTPLCSNDSRQTISTLDTDFIVGTTVFHLESNGWSCTWKHISNDPSDEKKYVQSEKPILQNQNAKIKDEYKFKNIKDYWKDKSRTEEERWREAESAIASVLDKAIANDPRFLKIAAASRIQQ